jgi:hypothetical protein
MKPRAFIIFFSCFVAGAYYISISSPYKSKSLHTQSRIIKTDSSDEIKLRSSFNEGLFEPEKKLVWGYRFSVTGDFNGDGKKETMDEHFCSSIDGRDTAKYVENVEMGGVSRVMRLKPVVEMVCTDPNIYPFHPFSDADQVFGFRYVTNLGDLDGNGTDEIGYVMEWADWSSCNSYRVVTYTGTEWKQILAFATHDWIYPPLPEVSEEYYIMGTCDRVFHTKEHALNDTLEQQLRDFGIIRKLPGYCMEAYIMADSTYIFGDTLEVPPADYVIGTYNFRIKKWTSFRPHDWASSN